MFLIVSVIFLLIVLVAFSGGGSTAYWPGNERLLKPWWKRFWNL